MISNILQFGMNRVCNPKRTDISAVPVIPIILRNTMRGVKMKLIKLTQNRWAMVDDEDYQKVNQFKWSASKTKIGDFVAVTSSHGERGLLMHRFIMQAPKGMDVDHIYHNKLDNRKSKLRICTRSQNMQNSRRHRDSKSIYKGVHWSKERKCWQVEICHNGKNRFVCRCDNEQDAARAYDTKARELFGAFAYANFPNPERKVV